MENRPSASGSSSASKEASRLSVGVFPKDAAKGTELFLAASGFSLEDGRVEWFVNGAPKSGRNARSLETGLLRKGDAVQAKVFRGGEEVLSDVVVLKNAPPEIRTVRFVPEVFRPGDSLGVEVTGSDPDGDPVTYEFLWEKIGRPAGGGSRLEGSLKRNDAVSLTVTAFDGESRGRPVIVRREIRNTPPMIEGARDARLEGTAYTCRIQAVDADGDRLAFSLKESPPGMSIDAGSGVIRWNVPADFHGKAPITVAVADGNGGDASFSMFLTIEEEPKKEPPGEAKRN